MCIFTELSQYRIAMSIEWGFCFVLFCFFVFAFDTHGKKERERARGQEWGRGGGGGYICVFAYFCA